MRLQLVPNDPKFRMHCPICGVGQTKFKLGNTEVEIRSAASTMPMVDMLNGTNEEFKKGHVESVACASCGRTFGPMDAYSTV